MQCSAGCVSQGVHCAVQIDMYAFSFENPVSKESHHFLVPAMDMVNYCFDANAEIRMTQDGEAFVARAIKTIQ